MRHTFRPDPTRATVDARGRALGYCAVCGKSDRAKNTHEPGHVYGGDHPFRLGTYRRGGLGRRFAICATCGKASSSTHHTEREVPTRVGVRRVSPTRRAPDPLPWELRLLAIACDRAIAAGPDRMGWRVLLRATDLRRTIEAIPQEVDPFVGEPLATEPPPESTEPEPIAPPRNPSLPVEVYAPREVIARARSVVKGIRSDRYRALVARAIVEGASVEHRGTGHLRVQGGPLDRPLTVSTTSDGGGRSWANLRAQAKRAGLNVEGL